METKINADVKTEFSISKKEKKVLRELAKKKAELAALPVMEERKRQWKASNDLKPERPMIMVETIQVQHYLEEDELECENIVWRNLEKSLRTDIRHAVEIGDDIVLEPVVRIAWDVKESDFGIEAPLIKSQVKDSIAWKHENIIKTSDDIAKLKPRKREVLRVKTLARKAVLEDTFGDILPIAIGSKGLFDQDDFPPQIGLEFQGMTMQLYEFLGNERMMLWSYDEPESLHKLMQFITEDRMAYLDWMNSEKLYGSNCNELISSGGAHGYNSTLAEPVYNGIFTSKDIWGWLESQETIVFSPKMYAEFFLPYLAEIAKRYGLIYYGCCEPVHDKIELIKQAMPNLRSVSVSGWSDYEKVAESLGNKYVYSKKPKPQFISGFLDWDNLRKDLQRVIDATKKNNCILQLIYRDIIKLQNNDRRILRQWTDMARKMLDT
ncbi:MAG: uroporphyrinogen decarboxylase/cobalamine-independent methonine synthase family protein [Candidatus Humimicrobiaceae bacterium]